jgi:biopolymer transport protein ExbD
MRRRRPFFDSNPNEEEMSLTPLIDVVFVVLILFILVGPMVEIDQIQLACAPTREVTNAVSPLPLSIHVRSDDTIWINEHPLDHDRIGPFLKALYQQQPDKNPQLFQDKNAHFGTYQLVKNAVEKAGYSELEVVLTPES